MSEPGRRHYNALTAAELLVVIPNEVKQALEKAIGCSPAITYPLASWSWTLTLKQNDPQTGQNGDTPERIITAGEPEVIEQTKKDLTEKYRSEIAEERALSANEFETHLEAAESPADKILRSLRGGSNRFKNRPPSPTEVREAEGLPLPEA